MYIIKIYENITTVETGEGQRREIRITLLWAIFDKSKD